MMHSALGSRTFPCALVVVLGLAGALSDRVARADQPWPSAADPDATLASYFADQVRAIAETSDTRRFHELEQWTAERPRLQQEFADMLGLSPLPERTPLQPTITGTLDQYGVVVERLHFQAMPGLYVTANLYRPQAVAEPLPTILYVCGHSSQRETRDGADYSFGNKTGYQRHGIWFARHGYVCLIIDTVQWGEFLGTHWGTYRDGSWDWMTRGYTPAGVETWCGIRALDYLETRADVDMSRIGLTGRSGGGAYSWFIAALDDRPRAIAPVAGITDLQNHVVDGCISGHCDCMFMVNYHRWDYPQLAALVAPRPLLFANSDRDPIFPLDGVLRTSDQVRHVYGLYGAKEDFGMLITPGPHQDTPELQVGVFRWMDRFLKDLDQPIDEPAVARFDRAELRVFDRLPADQRVTSVEDYFADRLQAAGEPSEAPESVPDRLRRQSLAGWPQLPAPLDTRRVWSRKAAGTRWELWEFASQPPFRLRAIVSRPESEPVRSLVLRLVDSEGWDRARRSAAEDGDGVRSDQTEPDGVLRVYLPVRGIGPHAWSGSDADLRHLQRRFYLIGQTLAGMQTWDALRGIDFCRSLAERENLTLRIQADGEVAAVALYAAGLADNSVQTDGVALPEDYEVSAALLGAGRVAGLEDWLREIASH